MSSKYNYIAIEGNIGAGKTSLATVLADKYNGKLILEQFEDNSFLPKFYKDPDRYAFPLELTFLAERYQQLKDQLSVGDLFKSFIISDYFIDKSYIFASNNLKTDEFQLYTRLFSIISSTLPRPDMIVYLYLRTQQLVKNIESRGREYEKDIKSAYLDDIQARYLSHFKTLKDIPILILDTNKVDFVNNAVDLGKIEAVIFKDYPSGITLINMK